MSAYIRTFLSLAVIIAAFCSCGGDSHDDRLHVRAMGNQGFLIRHGGDGVLSVPMYSNPTMDEIVNDQIPPDPELVHRFLGDARLSEVRAMITGHAHYDHLMDLPYVWPKTDRALIYATKTAKHILAGYAPDPAAHCTPVEPDWPLIPRDRVVAFNDPDDDRVDTRLCAGQETCTGISADRPGSWVDVPGYNLRLRALCSSHPDQLWIVKFAGGCWEADYCRPPELASDYREGTTLALLIDFLDGAGNPIFRVYYQDAPTDGPVGHVHEELLVEKGIDLAILCVGNYEIVRDQPGEIIAALNPRYVLAGHWEDFFIKPGEPPQPQPFLNLNLFMERLEAACPPRAGEEWCWLADQGMDFSFSKMEESND
jgi:L-ascorbate metabolism protein UlaG (beta-lactamase superfamily)